MSAATSFDYSGFFKFDDPLGNRALRLEPQNDDWLTVKMSYRLANGEEQPPQPACLKGYMGGIPYDVLWSGLVSILCVSYRVIDLLLENKFTGWGTYPVDVYDRNGKPLPRYYGFAVRSYAGREDISLSEVITKPASVARWGTRKVRRGLYFDPKKWDGSDFFRVGGKIVVTKQARDSMKRAKVANVNLIPLPEVEVDTIVDEFWAEREARLARSDKAPKQSYETTGEG